METRVFMSFFFSFPALKLPTVAMAMLANFALGKKIIKFLKFTNLHSLGVYSKKLVLIREISLNLNHRNYKIQ